MFALAGCKKKRNQAPAEERGSIHRDAGVSGPSNTQHGSQFAKTVERKTRDEKGEETTIQRPYKNCRNPVPVTQGDLNTPEGTLWYVFESMLIPDENEAFKKFYELIDPDFQRETDARRYWFAASRKHDLKAFLRLVYTRKDPSFDICETRKEGPNALRIFVGKSPPVGSNPPFVLHKVNDKWLLKSYTPH